MKAIITGVTGQDGSHLADLLLSKGYEVVGVARRSSSNNKERIRHILGHERFTLEEADITDPYSFLLLLKNHPDVDELYNLAAQSHVGTSFDQPGITWDVTGKGVINILEALVSLNMVHVKFYQASSSEMFGASYDARNEEKYQDENTKFLPQSPYAIAKCAAHYTVRLYREAYGIHASSGILFNHECVTGYTPIIYKIDNNIHIDCIEDFFTKFVPGDKGRVPQGIQLWDKNGWVDISYASSFKHDTVNDNKGLRVVNSRNSVYSVTNDHICILEDGSEEPSKNLQVGDKVKTVAYPESQVSENLPLDFCEMLGMIVGDGHINGRHGHFTNKDGSLRKRFAELWSKYCGNTNYYPSVSGFTEGLIGRLDLKEVKLLQDYEVYTVLVDVFGHRYKKVPHQILNSSVDCMEAFLIGYNSCDGLKANSCTYQFKNFKTNSPVLASGLLFLVSKVTGQKYNITVEESWSHGKQQLYYSINLLSDRESSIEKYNKVRLLLDIGIAQRQIHRETGISRSFIRKVSNGYVPFNTHHLELCSNEIKKIIDIPNYEGRLFDLATSSGTFHAGIGQAVVHNSPVRGENFVTRKITKWIGEFKNWSISQCANRYDAASDSDNIIGFKHTILDTRRVGSFPKLRLGNLDSYRDWGYAGDYVEAMWMMLQQNRGDDYVICTGETHSIRDFLTASFSFIGIDNWEDYVVIDPKFYRPAEVDYLRGDCSKARRVLGWEPKHSFEDLVKMMVEHDTKELL